MTARSFLYCPADRPDRLHKAVARAGDALIADLEDAVVPDRKDTARATLATWLADLPAERPQIWVRVNSGARCAEDLAAAEGADGIVLPKADLASVRACDALLDAGVAVVALVESALGLQQLDELAAHPRVSRLALGEADLAADLGVSPRAEQVWWSLRTRAVVASSAAGLPGPTGPVHLDVRDLDGLRSTTLALREAGFSARSAVHPDQVPVIEQALTPTPEEATAARLRVTAWDDAVRHGTGVALDERGRMLDEAVVRSARRVVATADRLGL